MFVMCYTGSIEWIKLFISCIAKIYFREYCISDNCDPVSDFICISTWVNGGDIKEDLSFLTLYGLLVLSCLYK